jgi:hypothetical protein
MQEVITWDRAYWQWSPLDVIPEMDMRPINPRLLAYGAQAKQRLATARWIGVLRGNTVETL